MENDEVFKDVLGYEGAYKVSNLGRVKSLERVVVHKNGYKYPIKERILKPVLKRGYPSVNLCLDDKRKSIKIHRLVALAFMPNPESKATVNHINGIKTDNRLENLEN